MADIRTTLKQVYEEHRALLFSVALSITRSQADAEDAIHTAFGKALRANGLPDHPKAYMVRAVRNCALDARQRQVAPASEAMIERSTDPEYPADTLEFLLSQVNDVDREILLLKCIQGQSFREIGELLDTSANSIATRYRRAIEHLRTISNQTLLS